MRHRYHHCFHALLGTLLAGGGLLAHGQAFTPPAAATSSQTTPYNDLVQAQALAVDGSGNVFFSRPGSGILAEKPAGGGAEITLYTLPAGGGGYPKGVATNGTSAYITDYAGHLWQVPVGGGAAVDLLPACNTIDAYYLGTQAVTTDGLGNVYTAGNNETALFKITSADACSVVAGATLDANSRVAADAAGDLAYSTGGVLYSLPAGASAPVAVAATFNSIVGLRSDATGNVFVTTYSGIVEVPFVGGALNGSLAFTVLSGSSASDVAVGADDTVYSTDGTNLFKNVLGGVRFGTTAVGTAAPTQTLNVLFNSAQTLSGLQYLAGSSASTELTNTGAGSCAAGQSYAAGTTCTLTLSFTPRALGARNSAVVLSSAAGVIGTAAASAEGSGAGLVADPGTQTALGRPWRAPDGVAVGSDGSVLVADKAAGTLSFIPATGSTATVIASGLPQPSGVALAPDGTAYAVTGSGALVRVPFAGGVYGTSATVATGLTTPQAVAVGPNGDVFVANTGAGTVLKYSNQAGEVAFSSSLPVGSGFKAPAGLAFSTAGNLYVADTTAGNIFEVSGTTTTSAVSGLSAPTSIALDDSGGLYVLQSNTATVLHIAFSNGSYNTNSTASLGTGLTAPAGLAADNAGNLYIADAGAPGVVRIQRTAGLLNLGSRNVGTSTAVQSLSFSNDGDSPLSLGTPLYTEAGNTGDFSLSNTSASACAAGGSLASGAACTISASFAPTATGVRTATLTLSSNAANGSVTAAFTGIGINLPSTTLTLSTSPSGTVTYGTAVTATAVVAPPSGATTAPTGTVSFFVNGTIVRTVPLAGGSVSALLSGLPAGGNTIDATYSGDGNYAASSGATQTITVTLAPTATAFNASISSLVPVPPGSSATLTATVTANVASSKPTGTVTFVSNGVTLASAPVNAATGQATATITTLPQGTYTIDAVYGGDSGFASSTSGALAVSIRTQQFDLTAPPTALTVTAPGAVNTSFSILPISGYVGGVDLSCSGLPANTQCTFLPAVVQFSGTSTAAQTVNLTITTNTPAPTTVAAWLLPAGALAMFGAWRKRRQVGTHRLALTLLMVLVPTVSLLSLSGCGGGSANMTPQGSSTITVTATATPNGTTTVPASGAGNIVKTFTFTLNVQ